jgi:hypothetical protein
VSINVDSQNPETNIKTNLNKQIPRTEQSLDNNRDQTLEMAISILIMTGIREYESRFGIKNLMEI